MGVEVVVCWEFVWGRRRRLRTPWRGGRMSNVEGGGSGGRRVVEGASVGEFAEGIPMPKERRMFPFNSKTEEKSCPSKYILYMISRVRECETFVSVPAFVYYLFGFVFKSPSAVCNLCNHSS